MNNCLDSLSNQQGDDQNSPPSRERPKKRSGIPYTDQSHSNGEGGAWDLLDMMPEVIILVNQNGQILWANDTASKQLNRSVEALTKAHIWDVYSPQKIDHYKTLFNKVVKTGQPLGFIDKDNGRWIELSIYPVAYRNDKPLEVAFQARDITAQIEAEEALKRVSLQLISTQEDERYRISQELHDEIGQQMTALLLELHSVHTALSKDHVHYANQVNEAIHNLEAIMKRLRQVFYQLSNPFLDNTALIKVLGVHCSSFTKSTGISIDISCPDDFPALPNIYEVTLYRFVQEGLTNAAKHGKANAVWINLDVSDDEVNISLEDDGLGFDPIPLVPGLGLKGIQERFLMLRGSFEIESTSGKGTKLFGSLPFIPNES